MAIQQTAFKDKMRNPRTRIYLPEVFIEADKKETVKERIDVIKAYKEKSSDNEKLLRDYLQCLYHPLIKLDLPDTPPPYDNTQYVDYDLAPQTLQRALARVTYFIAGQSNYVSNTIKRENIFIQTLEGLHKKDSELYVSLLKKIFPVELYPNLGMHVFYEVAPEFLPESVIDIEGIIAEEKKLGMQPKTKKQDKKNG